MTNSPSSAPAKTPIFLLKTKSTPHDGYEEYFSTSGHYDPSFVPVLEHRFLEANLRRVRDLFVSGSIGEQYGGLIFTSQRAVEGFARVIMDEVGGMFLFSPSLWDFFRMKEGLSTGRTYYGHQLLLLFLEF